jgi:hypothetical protein
MSRRKGRCRQCPQQVELTDAGKIDEHTNRGKPCPGSGSTPKGVRWHAHRARRPKKSKE